MLQLSRKKDSERSSLEKVHLRKWGTFTLINFQLTKGRIRFNSTAKVKLLSERDFDLSSHQSTGTDEDES